MATAPAEVERTATACCRSQWQCAVKVSRRRKIVRSASWWRCRSWNTTGQVGNREDLSISDEVLTPKPKNCTLVLHVEKPQASVNLLAEVSTLPNCRAKWIVCRSGIGAVSSAAEARSVTRLCPECTAVEAIPIRLGYKSVKTTQSYVH